MSSTTSGRTRALHDADWQRICSAFPRDLDAMARSLGGVHFWRNLPCAHVLLRMLLLWALCDFGLRSVAGWAARSRWAQLTDDALRYRFRRCEPFLLALLTHVLQSWMRVEHAPGLPLRLVDATMLALPGSKHCLRVHAVFDPRHGRMTSVELTDDSQGERATRGPHRAGDLFIADRAYARAGQLIALSLRSVWWIVRAYLPTLPLYDENGARVDFACEALCAAARASTGPIERFVTLREGKTHVQARLILVPLPEDKAEAARTRLRQRASRRQTMPDPKAQLLAGFVTLVTTLPSSVASAEAVLQWYRVRWQIELFFKRCKSLLRLHTIVSACPQLQRVRILASLLVIALVDRSNAPVLAAEMPQDPSRAPRPVSIWRWTQIHALDLTRAVSGHTPLAQREARFAQVESRLRERPRTRHQRNAPKILRSIPTAVPIAA